MLQEAHQIDQFLARVFPETQGPAETVVETHRKEQLAEGVHIGPLAGWLVEEVGIAAEARLKTVVHVMHRLETASLALVCTLWPGAVQTRFVNRLARWLEAGSARVDAWRASAPRAGTEMAINFVMSWHPQLRDVLASGPELGAAGHPACQYGGGADGGRRALGRAGKRHRVLRSVGRVRPGAGRRRCADFGGRLCAGLRRPIGQHQ